MILQVVQGPKNTILRTASKPVKKITAELRNFTIDMTKTMIQKNGVGIAAPQVGRNVRVAVVKLNPGEKNEIIFPIINPEILEISGELEDGQEGCLSLPGVWGQVRRAARIVLRYKNLKSQQQTLELCGFNARIIQHEVDHLDGKLFIDRAHEIEKVKKEKN